MRKASINRPEGESRSAAACCWPIQLLPSETGYSTPNGLSMPQATCIIGISFPLRLAAADARRNFSPVAAGMCLALGLPSLTNPSPASGGRNPRDFEHFHTLPRLALPCYHRHLLVYLTLLPRRCHVKDRSKEVRHAQAHVNVISADAFKPSSSGRRFEHPVSSGPV